MNTESIMAAHVKNESTIHRHLWTLWSMVYGLQAQRILEFGHGVSTAVMLHALERLQLDHEQLDERTLISNGLGDQVISQDGHFDDVSLEYHQCRSTEMAGVIGDNGPYDFVLHDGAHDALTVAGDLSRALPRLKRYGILMVHDVEQHSLGKEMREGVTMARADFPGRLSGTVLPFSDGMLIARVEETSYDVGEVKTDWHASYTKPAVSVPWLSTTFSEFR